MLIDGQKFVVSPDGYWLLLVPDEPSVKSEGVFRFVSIHVSTLAESICFYQEALHARLSVPPDAGKCDPNSAMMSFGRGVSIELVQLDAGTPLQRGAAAARLVVETEQGGPRAIGERISRW